ncbi:MAG: aspartate 1-decarboxylase [Chloroflexi bacterium]|nr:aspartate 1-decarboxylase [Chloroflexota bacterium]MCH8195837.1 aspartate 1-decarboxylase [Chloroflexota bacterium]
MRTMLKSKLHRATVTDANVDYEGSITLDPALMRAADILPYEQVHVLDVDNGARLETYAIEGRPGEVCINGAAARLVEKGHRVIILTYRTVESLRASEVKPRLVYLNERNEIVHTGIRDRVAGGT